MFNLKKFKQYGISHFIKFGNFEGWKCEKSFFAKYLDFGAQLEPIARVQGLKSKKSF